MLYDVYLDGTAEYVGQTQDRSEILWKEREMREVPSLGLAHSQMSPKNILAVILAIRNAHTLPSPRNPLSPAGGNLDPSNKRPPV